ncbi:neuromedin-U receptor 2-like [Amphiura filiformis]|uniref:neuromedin-U receptor 2-like n=1 Tax=Amphiura filiformis TaxID=82378 RepID=UPI003B217A0F
MELYAILLIAYQSLIFIIGTPGNMLIIIVYAKKQMKTSTDFYIIGLAVADLLVCLFTPLSINHWIHMDRYTNLFLCRFALGSTFWTVFNSLFIITAIAFNRHDAVTRHHQRLSTPRTSKIITFVSYILALLLIIPSFFSYGIDRLYGPTLPGQCRSLKTTPSWQSFSRIGFVSLANLVCFFTVVVLYVRLYLKSRRQVENIAVFNINPNISTANRPDSRIGFQQTGACSGSQISVPISVNPNEADLILSHNNARAYSPELPSDVSSMISGVFDRQLAMTPTYFPAPGLQQDVTRYRARVLQQKTTQMLFLATIVFFATWFPSNVMKIFRPRFDHYQDTNPVLYALIRLISYLFYINNAVKPFIYGFIDKRFRRDCKKILKSCKCKCIKL